ncbi:MAG: exodeoxyribonuclease VII small subunit [Chlamydiales bacterium]|jgi:exodeoxyribonuclease VII small subunit
MTNEQADPGTSQEADDAGFDARLRRLEQIVQGLEEGELDLEPAIERYREGIHLLKGCREILGSYKRQVEELTQEAEAALRPYPGDPDVAPGPGA